MFNKLRNKFLILNLCCITLVMLVSFLAAYTITYNNVYEEENLILKSYHKTDKAPMQVPPPRVRPTFFIDVQNSGISRIIPQYFYSESECQSLLEIVNKSGAEKGKFSFSGSYWLFVKERMVGGERIYFFDFTSAQKILTSLIYTFFAISIFVFLVFVFISLYFANRAIAPIKEAFFKQQDFISDASHEIKTPLTSINTNIDVMLGNEDRTIKEEKKWLYNIKKEIQRLSKLTNDLLYLARLEQEEEKTVFSKVDMSGVLNEAVLNFEAAFYERGINLDVDIEDEVFVKGSQERLKQLIMILLDNAYKYTNKSGNVSIKLKKGQEAKLTVENTGENIPKEDLKRIFDRFYRVDKSRNRGRGGYGLGLSIAKAIVNEHKGEIGASSENKINAFYVKLPLYD